MRTVVLLGLAALGSLSACTKYAQENTAAPVTATASPAARSHVTCNTSYRIVSGGGDGHLDTVQVVGSRAALKLGGRAGVKRDAELQVSGWATTAEKQPVSAVCPLVDGHVIPGSDVTMDVPRPDVAAAGQASGAAAVGYRGTVPLHGLKPGPHRFTVGRLTPRGVAPLPESVTLVLK